MLKFVNNHSNTSSSVSMETNSITLQVGKGEHQIAGLNRKTTCLEVLVDFIEKQQTINKHSSAANGQHYPMDKSPLELAQNYEIVENYRGKEKALSPKDQILKVWSSWREEQQHVTLSLRKKTFAPKSKDASSKRHDSSKHDYRQYKLSSGQKRRIRRNLRRYQQAMKRASVAEGADSKMSVDDKTSFVENMNFVLSEEQFVDGVHTGPECLLYNAKFGSLRRGDSDLASEHCAYRRNRHRRRSFINQSSDVQFTAGCDVTSSSTPCHNQHRRSSKSSSRKSSKRHRSASKGRISKSSREQLLRHHGNRGYVIAEAITNATTDSNDGDADDEKSVMASGARVPSVHQRLIRGQKLITEESYLSGTTSGSTTTTGTDSSTTSSEMSTLSGTTSGTSSSETSSASTDFMAQYEKAMKEREDEQAAKLQAEKATASKVTKKSKLFSFSRKKKRPPPTWSVSPLSTAAPQKHESCKPLKSVPPKQAFPSKPGLFDSIKEVSLNQQNEVEPLEATNESTEAADDDRSLMEFRTLSSVVGQRGRLLAEQKKSERNIDAQIERICGEISKLKATETDTTTTITTSNSSWIQTCDDKNQLLSYINWCQQVIDRQIKIEENKRTTQILAQNLEDEKWANDDGSNDDREKNFKRISFYDDECDVTHEQKSNDKTKLDDILFLKETSLYDNLKLSSEIDTLQYQNTEQEKVNESKEEQVVDLVREMACSDEGVPPELWEEYGDQLIEQDAQLMTLANMTSSSLLPHYNGDQFDVSTWIWCHQCKEEIEQEQQLTGSKGHVTLPPKHSRTHTKPADISLSKLPLPLPPKNIKAEKSKLLPMYPVPNCDESDYEDLDVMSCTQAQKKTDKSVEVEATPSSNASTDDSGNASAGSISSFTSVDVIGLMGEVGSRGSCDGESSPPPSGEHSYCDHSKHRLTPQLTFSVYNKNQDPSKLVKKVPQNNYHHMAPFHPHNKQMFSNNLKKERFSPLPHYNGMMFQQTNFPPHFPRFVGKPQNYNHFYLHEPQLQHMNYGSPHDRLINRYQTNGNFHLNDNDSDTGLSSLHSMDSSELITYSETLV